MSKKIIIIDDEAHIRMLLEQTLEDFEEENVEILMASNGKEGLDLIKAEKPDLVFCDVMMPEVNGYEVCAEVKKDSGLGSVFFVLLTAKGQEADKDKGATAGADLYLTKPFDPDFVIQKTSDILGISV